MAPAISGSPLLILDNVLVKPLETSEKYTFRQFEAPLYNPFNGAI